MGCSTTTSTTWQPWSTMISSSRVIPSRSWTQATVRRGAALSPGQYIAPGGGGDLRPSCPQQGYVPYDDLTADRKGPGQGGGAHRPVGLFQFR